MKNIELVYASEEEEFFYEDSNEPVAEGDPIGVEWDEIVSKNEFDTELKVHFNLFNNIYWSLSDEKEI